MIDQLIIFRIRYESSKQSLIFKAKIHWDVQFREEVSNQIDIPPYAAKSRPERILIDIAKLKNQQKIDLSLPSFLLFIRRGREFSG